MPDNGALCKDECCSLSKLSMWVAVVRLMAVVALLQVLIFSTMQHQVAQCVLNTAVCGTGRQQSEWWSRQSCRLTPARMTYWIRLAVIPNQLSVMKKIWLYNPNNWNKFFIGCMPFLSATIQQAADLMWLFLPSKSIKLQIACKQRSYVVDTKK